MTMLSCSTCRNAAIALALMCAVLMSTSVVRTDAAEPSKEFTNKSGVKFRLIPAGEFMMGSPEKEPGRAKNEGPLHKVRITKPFYIGVREVTQGEWTKVMGTTFKELSDKNWKNRPAVGPSLPMYWVSWFDALAFCNKLSEKEGRKPYYKLTNIKFENYGKGALDKADVEVLGGNGYRLPTEAQWEYACRAGSPKALGNGKDITSKDGPCPNLGDIGWYAGNIKDLPKDKVIQPAGSRKPNTWGLYDMNGGMMEWCHDEFDAEFYAKSPVDDPVNPISAKIRNKAAALRSGAFFLPPYCCRSAWRFPGPTCARYPHIGFRVALPAGDRKAKKADPPKQKKLDPAAVKSLKAPSFVVPKSGGIRMILIKPGTFTMGSPQSEVGRGDDETQHKVTISKPFYMAETETTHAQYLPIMWPKFRPILVRRGRYSYSVPELHQGGSFLTIERQRRDLSRRAMDGMTWEDAAKFGEKVTAIERAAGRLPKGYAYRLPTEAEWEYACRAGTTGPFNVKADKKLLFAVCGGFAGCNGDRFFLPPPFHGDTPQEVAGARTPNAWGLYDMHGNLYEWCLDWYGPYPKGPVTDPVGPGKPSKPKRRVARGGCFLSGQAAQYLPDVPGVAVRNLRSASRNCFRYDHQMRINGVRLVLAPELKAHTLSQ